MTWQDPISPSVVQWLDLHDLSALLNLSVWGMPFSRMPMHWLATRELRFLVYYWHLPSIGTACGHHTGQMESSFVLIHLPP
jgi:hypothetical protein